MTLIGPDGGEATTFGEMLSQIRSVAYRLIQEQIAFGDRVALISENHTHWVIAYLGILYRGAIAVPLDQAANTVPLIILQISPVPGQLKGNQRAAHQPPAPSFGRTAPGIFQ